MNIYNLKRLYWVILGVAFFMILNNVKFAHAEVTLSGFHDIVIPIKGVPKTQMLQYLGEVNIKGAIPIQTQQENNIVGITLYRAAYNSAFQQSSKGCVPSAQECYLKIVVNGVKGYIKRSVEHQAVTVSCVSAPNIEQDDCFEVKEDRNSLTQQQTKFSGEINFGTTISVYRTQQNIPADWDWGNWLKPFSFSREFAPAILEISGAPNLGIDSIDTYSFINEELPKRVASLSAG